MKKDNFTMAAKIGAALIIITFCVGYMVAFHMDNFVDHSEPVNYIVRK